MNRHDKRRYPRPGKTGEVFPGGRDDARKGPAEAPPGRNLPPRAYGVEASAAEGGRKFYREEEDASFLKELTGAYGAMSPEARERLAALCLICLAVERVSECIAELARHFRNETAD